MSDLVTPVLIFVGVIAVTVVLFGGWVVVSIFRSVGNWLDRGAGRPVAVKVADRLPCGNTACRHGNAAHARFCSRCGQPVGADPVAVATRPVAHRSGRADMMSDAAPVNRLA